jgi:hypothetical protein
MAEELTRRNLLRLGIGVGGAVALLPWGGRALAGPAATAVGARQLADPVPTGGKMLANMGFMFPDLPAFAPDPDFSVATGQLMALASSLLDPNATDRDNVTAFGSIITYLGQFIDHDNFLDLEPQPTTLFGRDNSGNLTRPSDGAVVQNFESFRFDLSSVYGGGPTISPQLYEVDGLHFRVVESNTNGVRDLPRNADETAVLVEKRNDENEIIAQIHTAFLKFHNAVVDQLHLNFADAYAMVRRYYQWIVIHQFLPDICGQDVVDGLMNGSIQSFYKPSNPNAPLVPVEMSVAAYRFGHSLVRKAYEVTTTTGKLQVFNGTANDLHGGRLLPAGRQIDFGNFVRPLMRPENAAHFNVPRFIDTLISSGLFTLPIGGPSGAEPSGSNVLAFRNLLRGFFYGLPSGQDVARKMGESVIAPGDALPDAVDNSPVSAGFANGTPLWYYVLREAENGGGKTLGRVGARIVADSFLGVLKADPDALLHDNSNANGKFQPMPPIAPAPGQFGIEDLLVFAGVAIRPGASASLSPTSATPVPSPSGTVTSSPTPTPSGT